MISSFLERQGVPDLRLRLFSGPSIWILSLNLIVCISILATGLLSVNLRTPLSFPVAANTGNQIFSLLVLIELILVILLSPALCISHISGERERGTLPLLLSTGIRPIEVIVYKWLAALLYLVFFIGISFPVMLMASALGGVEWWQLVISMLVLFVTGAFLSSLALLVSSICRHTSSSWVIGYGLTALCLLVLPVTGFLISVVTSSSNNDGRFLDWNLALWSSPIISLPLLTSGPEAVHSALGLIAQLFFGLPATQVVPAGTDTLGFYDLWRGSVFWMSGAMIASLGVASIILSREKP